MTPQRRCLTGRVWEEWRPVVGQEEFYEVSSLGRVRSRERRVPTNRGSRLYPSQIIKPLNGGTYPEVNLSSVICGPRRRHRVHALVMAAFVGPRPPGFEVCHRNGNRRDNRAVNLRYDTRRGNSLDALIHGTTPVGVHHYKAVLTDDIVRVARTLRTLGVPTSDIAAWFGLNRGTVSNAVLGKSWKHVSS